MDKYLSKLDNHALKILKIVGQEADSLNCQAYLVGGIVRDLILGRRNLDLDVVIEKKAIEIAKKIAKELKVKLTVYPEFKTASLSIRNMRIDFATTRKEYYLCSGALPKVEEGSLIDDLFRRDFSINTLAISLNANNFGKLIDKFNGLADLKKKIIRILHGQSFIDDPTRILRAIRFEQRLKFKMEKRTRGLLVAALKGKVVDNVKPQRYFAEFKKILIEDEVIRCLCRLDEFKGFDFIENNFKFDLNLLKRINNNLRDLNKSKVLLAKDKGLYYLIGLLNGFYTAFVEKLINRFNLTKEERTAVLEAKECDKVIKNLLRKELRPSEIYQVLRPFNENALIYYILCAKSNLVKERITQYLTKYKLVKLSINGYDIKMLGLPSGKKTGEVLREVLYDRLDNKIINRNQELKTAKKYLKKGQHG